MLHVDVYGDGPDLVLVHGWGMHGGLWQSWATELGRSFRVHVVDLPGHGHSVQEKVPQTLDAWAEQVGDVVPADACWLGWSLGGQVALAAAGNGQPVRSLVLLASTPRFVTAADWQTAVAADVFDQFAEQLENDIERTLGRFLALQVRTAEHGGETLRRLRAAWGSRPAPALQALHTGLEFLRECDLRSTLAELSMPVYWLLGERDTLVPPAVASAFPEVHTALVPGAGHAPFLSHPGHCNGQLQRWLPGNKQVQHAAG